MVLPLDSEVVKTTAAKRYPDCPKCKSAMDSRISRGPLVKLFLFWLPIKRYKCNKCGRKSYKLG